MAECVHAVGERVQAGEDGQGLGQAIKRKHGARKEKERHDKEADDELESLRIGQCRANGGADGAEDDANQDHENEGHWKRGEVVPAESGNQADTKENQALEAGNCRAAEYTAQDDPSAWDGGDKGFLQETELPVHNQFNARKDGREQEGHCDEAGSDEIAVAAHAGALEDGAEAVAHRQEVKERLGQGGDQARTRAAVSFQLAQPEDVDNVHNG
jgi:hypothetical protein